MNIFEKLIGLNKEHDQFLSDWDRRYQGGYLLVADALGKEYHPMYISERAGHIARIGKLELSLHKESPVDIKVWLPQSGYYNTTYGPLLIEQNPQRQWCRTFSNKTYRINSGENLSKLVNDINKPYYTKIDVLTSRQSTALSIFFTVKAHDILYSSLFYRERRIGSLCFSNNTIYLMYDFMQQEVQDLLKRQGATKWTIAIN